MKKIISLGLVFLLAFVCFTFPASAQEVVSINTSTSIETFTDGSYFIIETGSYPTSARASTKNGYKTATYYTSSNVAVWAVTVNGSFSYNGTTSTATSASCSITRYDSNTSTISKNAYTSGSSAVGTATVKYKRIYTDKTVTLTCDRNGTLS